MILANNNCLNCGSPENYLCAEGVRCKRCNIFLSKHKGELQGHYQDLEIEAMRAILNELSKLDQEAIKRVLLWLHSRYSK